MLFLSRVFSSSSSSSSSKAPPPLELPPHPARAAYNSCHPLPNENNPHESLDPAAWYRGFNRSWNTESSVCFSLKPKYERREDPPASLLSSASAFSFSSSSEVVRLKRCSRFLYFRVRERVNPAAFPRASFLSRRWCCSRSRDFFPCKTKGPLAAH